MLFLYIQIKAYADKYPKGGQEFAQQELSGVTLPSSFSATFDPWSVRIIKLDCDLVFHNTNECSSFYCVLHFATLESYYSYM